MRLGIFVVDPTSKMCLVQIYTFQELFDFPIGNHNALLIFIKLILMMAEKI